MNTHPNDNIPIVIISLKNSPRRSVIAQRLTSLGFNFEFFDGVEGKALTQQELSKVDFQFNPTHLRQPELTLGEVGCALSHIKVYEYMVENNIPQLLILEDDAIVHLDFKKMLRQTLKKLKNNFEIIFFDHGNRGIYIPFPPFAKKLPEHYKLVHYIRPWRFSKRAIVRATAYMLTLDGAKKLLSHAYPVRMPADFLTGLLQMNKLKAFGVEPSCVWGSAVSEIDAIEQRVY